MGEAEREEVISLDKSRIPEDKLDDPRLAEWEEALAKSWSDEAYVLQSCLHEAAHEHYAKLAGAVAVTLYGPVAFYDCETDTFDIGNMGVQPNFGDGLSVQLLAMARWYAAGGVAVRVLTGREEDPGDSVTSRTGRFIPVSASAYFLKLQKRTS